MQASFSVNLKVTKLGRVRKWGDPIMVQQGFDVTLIGTTNFQAVPLWNEVGGFGGVSNYLIVPRGDIDQLIALQVADNFTVAEKMTWLCGSGRPYFYNNDTDKWNTCTSIRWGTIVFGGQLVMVDEVKQIAVKPPDGIRRSMDMGKLVCFRKSEWGKTFANAPHLIQHATAAGGNNQYNPSPRGIISSPLWSPLDWDYTGGIQPPAFYLPMEWIEFK